MANKKPIIVFDLETDGDNPRECNVVQIAALVIDPIKLEIIPNTEFNIHLKPPLIDTEEYFSEQRMETINFHARVMSLPKEEVINIWKGGTDYKLGWSLFSDYVNRHNKGKTMYTAPIAAGVNLKDFDLIIAERLNEKFNVKSMFWRRDVIDLKDMIFYWFEGLQHGPANYRMDTFRQFFKIPVEGGHDAMKDVRDEAELIIKFMKLNRECAARIVEWKELSEEYGGGKSI